MSRLTERDEFGNANIIGVDSEDLQSNLEFKEFNKVTEALNRLAHYEDLAEKGLLVELPCNYNDKMFWIVKGRIKEVFFKGIRCDKGYKPQIIARYMENLNMKEEPICKAESIGKTIFLTQSEAEQVLKEM